MRNSLSYFVTERTFPDAAGMRSFEGNLPGALPGGGLAGGVAGGGVSVGPAGTLMVPGVGANPALTGNALGARRALSSMSGRHPRSWHPSPFAR